MCHKSITPVHRDSWSLSEAHVRTGLPRWHSGKESACQAGDSDSISGSGRFPGKGNGNSLQYSCLGNPTDRGAWWATNPWGHERVRYDLANKHANKHVRVTRELLLLANKHVRVTRELLLMSLMWVLKATTKFKATTKKLGHRSRSPNRVQQRQGRLPLSQGSSEGPPPTRSPRQTTGVSKERLYPCITTHQG